jgi:hypothetical protein
LAAKEAGIVLNRLGAGHEENYAGAVRMESKAGKQVGPVHTRYLDARAQSEAARPIGDHRPFVFVAGPDDAPYLLWVIRSDDLPQVVAALAENWGWTA